MPELRVYRSPWGAFPDVIIQTNMTTLQGGQNAWAKPGAQLICAVCDPGLLEAMQESETFLHTTAL